MKVFFTSSTAKYNEYKDLYWSIRDFLVSEGHILTRDYLPHVEKRLKNASREIPNIKEIYKQSIKAILESDVVIIEDTVSNFSTGHLITKALQFRKPVLVLWQTRKDKEFKQNFIHGIESDILDIAEYDNNNELIQSILRFLNKYQNGQTKNRFHLVLSTPERQYLDWKHFKNGLSRTEIIRKALREKIQNDKEYQTYLEQK